MLDALPACGSLREMVLSNNSLGTGILTNLATVLLRCRSLRRLVLANVNAQSQGVASLCQAFLRPMCSVVHLDLASNALQPEARCAAPHGLAKFSLLSLPDRTSTFRFILVCFAPD